MINYINFPSFICVRCPTELFNLSIGISLECPVTLIYVTDVIECPSITGCVPSFNNQNIKLYYYANCAGTPEVHQNGCYKDLTVDTIAGL